MAEKQNGKGKKRIRYAVVGLGWIAQEAILPAFKNAKKNSELTALISDDPDKLADLSKKYGVKHTYSYDEYDECLKSGAIDAVFIALPNSLHKEYTVRAADAGIHVLCEKPMSVTVKEAEAMIEAAKRNNVQLMIAYRLHFEEANMTAVDIVQSGDLGNPRFYMGFNLQNVEEGNIRLDKELSGSGPVDDLGIYCFNAARYLFQAEPLDVTAFAASKSGDKRFKEVPEMVSVIMHFPDDQLASFACGFGESKVSSYQVVGTEGDLKVDPAYSFADDLKHTLTVGDKVTQQTFPMRDQFAPQLLHFSQCVLEGTPVEPSGEEGLVDMQIIDAIRQAVESGKTVKLNLKQRKYRPTLHQEEEKPAVKKQNLVEVAPPGGKK
jgi:predicted dehydrogenase